MKTDSFYFNEVNKKKPMESTEKYPTVTNTEAVLYYGSSTKPYIKSCSPFIPAWFTCTYVDLVSAKHLPAASENCKLVIEKIA